jgi:hypothetical protein
MTQQMRSQGRLFMFQAGQRRIVDDQPSCWRSCDHGRHGGAASQEADLADRESGMRKHDLRCLAATFQINLHATVGDHVHVLVVLPLLTEHVAGLEANLSADGLQQF